MKQVAMIDLPDKRIQESSEAVGEKIFQDGFVESRESLPMIENRAEIPSVHPSAKKGTLYIQMDGGRLNTVTEGWREPKVATLYWGEDLEQVSEIRNKIVQKEYIAVLGDADELTGRLWAAACRWEWWKAERVVVLGDGATWIWNRAKKMFPNAILILDLYHAKEHIFCTGRKLFGGAGKQKDKGAEKREKSATQKTKDKKTNQWAQARIAELKSGEFDTLIMNLKNLDPKGAEKKESVESLINYLEENRDRTDYKTYKSLGLTVGSGCIESGVKNIVNQRMKGCGMRWAVDRAEYMLNLRAAHLSTTGLGRQRLVA